MNEIIVYDYDEILHKEFYKQVVNAVCVAGATGIRAYFQHPLRIDLICEATGDDGHWYLRSTFSKDWLPQMIISLQESLEELK